MDEKTKIFVDSNFFIALYNPQDILFEKAETLAKKVKKENLQIVFSTFIFLETVTVLSQRISREIAYAAGNRLMTDPSFTNIHVDQAIQKISWKIFQEIHQKNMSFVDCSILACMEYEGIKTLLTFDTKDFSPLQKAYRFGLL